MSDVCTVAGDTRPLREANPTSGEVACVPFKSNSLVVRQEKGVAMPSNRDTLTGLEVLYGNEKFHAGDTVYFDGDQCATLWAKRVYTIDDTKFILAPGNLIRVVERRDRGLPPGIPSLADLGG